MAILCDMCYSWNILGARGHRDVRKDTEGKSSLRETLRTV